MSPGDRAHFHIGTKGTTGVKSAKGNAFLYIARYLGGGLLFAGGAMLSANGARVPSLVLFVVLAALEAFLAAHESGRIHDLRVLLSLSWFLGLSASVLKLSALSNPFTLSSWLSFGLFFFLFLAAYDLLTFFVRRRQEKRPKAQEAPPIEQEAAYRKRLFIAIFIVAGLSFAGLLAEAIKFGFQFPLFVKDTPHAYTAFHISGVHYFVVSIVLVPALSAYYLMTGKTDRREKITLLVLNALGMLVPIVLLSRFHLALFFAFPILSFVVLQKRFKPWKLAAALGFSAVILVALFAAMAMARHYPEGYLEELFRFKDPSTPVAVQYPYMYLVNNFENFNLLTMEMTGFSYGTRQAFPLIALTGLKFVPAVNAAFYAPVYVTIPELNTVTILYDAYGDFGLFGVSGFGILLGALSSFLSERMGGRPKILPVLLYTQLGIDLTLSFFTTWMSHPTTWFWAVASVSIGIFCKKKGDRLW